MIPAASSVATNGAASAAMPAQGAEAPATAFDAILSLETLAATIASLDPAAAALTAGGAGLETLVDGEFVESGDSDTDDFEDEEGEDALAFLADLLNVTAVARPVNPGATPGEPAANEDVLSAPARPTGEPIAAVASVLDGEAPSTDKPAGVGAWQPVTELATLNSDAARQVDDIAGATRSTEWVHTTRHAATGPERSGIAMHVRDPRWADDFSARIATMVRANESSASLQLSPVDLGPMDVSVTVKDNQASIHFGAAQAETRALIEASIPRLREMLAAQGFNLMDASVSQGFSRQARGDGAPAVHANAEAETDSGQATRVTAAGLLDLYA